MSEQRLYWTWRFHPFKFPDGFVVMCFSSLDRPTRGQCVYIHWVSLSGFWIQPFNRKDLNSRTMHKFPLALNFPGKYHPAREMQDTFFIEKNPDIALRTHTSSVRYAVMEKDQRKRNLQSDASLCVVSYRMEATQPRTRYFHQGRSLLRPIWKLF